MKKFLLIIGVALCAVAGVAAGWLTLVTSDRVEAGATRAEALAALGEPEKTVGPVGSPAVERWSYADGTQVVLLEDRVVDAFFEAR